MSADISVEDIRHTAKSYRRDHDAALSNWLDSVADTLAARDRTIAEQAEALEGYRRAVVTDHEAVRNTETLSQEAKKRVLAKWAEQASSRLPAHEIAALRQRGVEVGG